MLATFVHDIDPVAGHRAGSVHEIHGKTGELDGQSVTIAVAGAGVDVLLEDIAGGLPQGSGAVVGIVGDGGGSGFFAN